MKTTGVQKSGYHKAWMSAGIFLTTVIVGGLAIFAATNLDDLKAGANGNMLTALNRDSLIDHVKNHDLIIGEGLSKLDTDILRVESKVDGLSGVGQQGNEISFQLSGLMSHVSGINTQITNVLEIFEGNESGSALVEEIDTIKLIVENNNAVINENYEKLDEKLEQLTYLISQMQCE
ncbi:MAG: hypothetical protein LBP53_04300 [Candidatus Peribacteria bacterium]|jgi:hypothetical protein|nr:hypothetical protein [Candidatus Peribacteria bacterium]